MFVSFSHVGTRHRSEGMMNQDVIVTGERGPLSVMALADGVSSCPHAREGAEISCRAVQALLLDKGHWFLQFDSKTATRFVLTQIRYELQKTADACRENPVDYSSTLAFILLDQATNRIMYWNLGDAVILGICSGNLRVIAAPTDSSCGCPTTTTKKVDSTVKTGVMTAEGYSSFMICSDGAWRTILSGGHMRKEPYKLLQTQQFDPFAEWIARQNPPDDSSCAILIPGKRDRAAA